MYDSSRRQKFIIVSTALPYIDFPTEDSDKYIEECPRKVQSGQDVSTKLAKVRELALNENSRSAYEDDPSLSTEDLLRHHDDSGIEMSPMKKDDSTEGEDFLERARKVSAIRSSFSTPERGKVRRPVASAIALRKPRASRPVPDWILSSWVSLQRL